MNRNDFRKLAHQRLKEARILLEKRQAGGAYYLAGYAVECALKACIAKQTKRYDFPDKNRAAKSWTHDLTDLVKAAGLGPELNGLLRSPEQLAFMFNWVLVRDWDEASRYKRGIALQTAHDLYESISNPNDGVLQWLSRHW